MSEGEILSPGFSSRLTARRHIVFLVRCLKGVRPISTHTASAGVDGSSPPAILFARLYMGSSSLIKLSSASDVNSIP